MLFSMRARRLILTLAVLYFSTVQSVSADSKMPQHATHATQSPVEHQPTNRDHSLFKPQGMGPEAARPT